MTECDTVSAITTAPGRGGVAIVRVSGPDAFGVASKLIGRTVDGSMAGRFFHAGFHEPTKQLNTDCRPMAPMAGTARSAGYQPVAGTARPMDCQEVPGKQLGGDCQPVAGKQLGGDCQPVAGMVRDMECQKGKLLDSGLVLVFKGPASYTGEDVVEFQTHGGSVTPRRVLEATFAAGARPARAGEFTLRAFLNGRLDLTEAEAVIDLVDAKSSRAADDAVSRLGGALRSAFEGLYKEAVAVAGELEHSLDFDEGELPPDFAGGLARRIAALGKAVGAAAATAREGRLLRDGALVVIAGLPNAGKSSLLNALLGADRAIVSPEAGTTRDSIEEPCAIGGWPVRLVDTAGLRADAQGAEAEGVERARKLVAEADVIIEVIDGAAETPPRFAADPRAITAVSKADLVGTAGHRPEADAAGWVTKETAGRGTAEDDNAEWGTAEGNDTGWKIAGATGHRPEADAAGREMKETAGRGMAEADAAGRGTKEATGQGTTANGWMRFSSTTGMGLADLKRMIAAKLAAIAARPADAAAADVSARERALLGEAASALDRAKSALAAPEFVVAANELRSASDALGRIVGRVYTDDILDAVFSRFCVGK